ncbi:membrane protein [Actinocatenispora thailandica]|uniref:Membrane protein n=1 Tax=Actinocatenispora thailandica TaxID=227318 RepID=A0A7R7DRU1_9ACTN|nr:anthrone oxygenase family protein [Actinocatenispora thailandica]BCJ36455.1 membrane protein [Actinocatenispora thailandica]
MTISTPPPTPAVPNAAPRTRRYATSGATMLMLSLLTVGLVAGVYFAFQVAVIPGLSRASDRTYAEAMNRINESIENPVFFAAFFGALAVTAIATVQQRRRGNRTAALFALLALALYVVGFGATIVGDIPLNEQLAAAGTAHAGPVIDRIRTPWLAWNAIRTVASVASLLCLGRALAVHRR